MGTKMGRCKGRESKGGLAAATRLLMAQAHFEVSLWIDFALLLAIPSTTVIPPQRRPWHREHQRQHEMALYDSCIDIHRHRSSSRLPPGQIYSQPKATGAGNHIGTILVSALDALKAQKNPVRLEDFALHNGLDALIEDDRLKDIFKGHPRVEWNAKLDLWSYKVRRGSLLKQKKISYRSAPHTSSFPIDRH